MNIRPDIALLQEASEPPDEIKHEYLVDPEPWKTEGPGKNRRWRTAIVRFNPSIEIEWIKPYTISQADYKQFAVSRVGTLSAAKVHEKEGEELILLSMYGLWESLHELTTAAGDLNSLYGYGENGSSYWGERYATIFSRMKALGLEFIGPQVPNGRQAKPWPSELPETSKNVPTYHSTRQNPMSASRQLDFVFASSEMAQNCEASALNAPEVWGPSDHCVIQIDL